MTYTYSDYITLDADTVAQEDRLRLHIKEVSDQITADVAKGPSSRSTSRLMDYRSELLQELKELREVNARKRGFGMTYANMNNARK